MDTARVELGLLSGPAHAAILSVNTDVISAIIGPDWPDDGTARPVLRQGLAVWASARAHTKMTIPSSSITPARGGRSGCASYFCAKRALRGALPVFIHTSGLLRGALAGETLPRWRRLSLEGDVACEERSPLCRTGLDSKGENNTTPLVHNVTRTRRQMGFGGGTGDNSRFFSCSARRYCGCGDGCDAGLFGMGRGRADGAGLETGF